MDDHHQKDTDCNRRDLADLADTQHHNYQRQQGDFGDRVEHRGQRPHQIIDGPVESAPDTEQGRWRSTDDEPQGDPLTAHHHIGHERPIDQPIDQGHHDLARRRHKDAIEDAQLHRAFPQQ